MPERTIPSPRWAAWVCYAILALAFFPYLLCLKFYPRPFVDDCFFNTPAINFLSGHGFIYKVRSDAPYGDTIWAYHFPFYPRLQVITFTLLGISQWSARAPQLIAATLAILVLCRALLRRGLYRTAVGLSIAWFGDRVLQEILYGRMEGLYLFWLALSFYFLTARPSRREEFAAGACVGMALGFHPVTVFFSIGALIWLVRRRSWGSMRGYLAGLGIPLFAILLCWLPNLRGSIEQFLWSASVVQRPYFLAWAECFDDLNIAKYWCAGILVVTLYASASCLKNLCTSDRSKQTDAGEADIAEVAALYSMCGLLGLLMVAVRAIYPYYFACLTVWPVIFLLSSLEQRRASSSKRVLWEQIVAVALFCCWVPSLRFSIRKLGLLVKRYPFTSFQRFDIALKTAIPKGARCVGSRELYILGRADGLVHFTPMPWYALPFKPDPGAYVILLKSDYENPFIIDPASLVSRRRIFAQSLYPYGLHPEIDVIVLGPVGEQAGGHS